MRKPAKWRQIPLENILESARKYQHVVDWAKAEPTLWWAGRQNGREFYAQCKRHMTSKANPWNSPYVIYVFEFDDNHAYVGLTFRPKTRQSGRLTRNPGDLVYEHHRQCNRIKYRILQ